MSKHVIGLYSPAMGSGKTTLAAAIAGHGYKRVRFAGPLKAMLRGLAVEAGAAPEWAERMVDGDLKEAPSPYLAGRTPRQAMQWLGTEWGRGLMHPDFWVEAWRSRAQAEMAAGFHVVADDMRFPNEFEAVRALGGLTVEVTRPGQGITQSHASEGALSSFPFDLRLINDHRSAIRWGLSGSAEIARAMGAA